MSSIWEELDKVYKAELFKKQEEELIEDYLKEPSAILMEVASVRGKYMAVEKNFPFSFYFSDRRTVHGRHGIRIKVQWNANKINPKDADGYFELHINMDYVAGSHKYKPSGDELSFARAFIKKYKVLFCTVWDGVLDAEDLEEYFKGIVSFVELKSLFNLKGREYYDVNHAKTLEELEEVVRKSEIFNMYD